MIHTLLDARRGDGIFEGRTLEIHVVWFKQNTEPVEGIGMVPSSATSFMASTADKLASIELERLGFVHPDKLVFEPVDVGSTFAEAAKIIESASPQQPRKRTFLQRFNDWRPLQSIGTSNVDSTRLLFISGSRGLARFLSDNKEGQSFKRTKRVFLVKQSKQVGESWIFLR